MTFDATKMQNEQDSISEKMTMISSLFHDDDDKDDDEVLLDL